jgi:hypothetical protein
MSNTQFEELEYAALSRLATGLETDGLPKEALTKGETK